MKIEKENWAKARSYTAASKYMYWYMDTAFLKYIISKIEYSDSDIQILNSMIVMYSMNWDWEMNWTSLNQNTNTGVLIVLGRKE